MTDWSTHMTEGSRVLDLTWSQEAVVQMPNGTIRNLFQENTTAVRLAVGHKVIVGVLPVGSRSWSAQYDPDYAEQQLWPALLAQLAEAEDHHPVVFDAPERDDD